MFVQNAMSALEQLVQSWAEAKLNLEQSLPLDDTWIHLIVGPAILLFAALIMRKPISSLSPWIVVLVLALLNEFIDLMVGIWPQREHRYGDTVSDFLLTMSIPTLLLIIGHRSAFARKRINTRERLPRRDR